MVKSYRLDRRFALPAIGVTMIAAGVAAALAFLLSSVTALAWVFGIFTVVALLNAVRLVALRPVVVRTDPTTIRVGGRLSARPVELVWSNIEGVEADATRLYLERGTDDTLSIPLSFVGERRAELVRDVYDRLNSANGYIRFEPS